MTVEKCTDNTMACSAPSSLLGLGYAYQTGATAGNGGGPNNNGNPRTQDITVPGMTTARQQYGYDAWNRLKTFTEGPVGGAVAAGETNCYDEHGNRAVQAPARSALTPAVANCTAAEVRAAFPGNRIGGGVIAGIAYDAAGGVTNDGRSAMRYNAEDLVARSWPLADAGRVTDYDYDGDNRRVGVTTAGTRTTFVYDAMGHLAAEYGGAVAMGGTSWVHGDALGSTRLVTGVDGAVRRRMDYWPFGEEMLGGQTGYRSAGLGYAADGEPRVKFTGKERDAETGLDYFGARYLSGVQGRFTTADEWQGGPMDPFTGRQIQPPGPLPYADIQYPQSLNKYAYVMNNPLRYTDPEGHCFWDVCVVEGYILTAAVSAGVIYYGAKLAVAAHHAMQEDASNKVPPPHSTSGQQERTTTAEPPPPGNQQRSNNKQDDGGGRRPQQKEPTPRERASQMGRDLVKEYKESGVGQGARSGQHGTPHMRAGQRLIEQANRLPKNDPLREALKTEGKRLQKFGGGVNH